MFPLEIPLTAAAEKGSALSSSSSCLLPNPRQLPSFGFDHSEERRCEETDSNEMNEACRTCAVRDGASFWSTIPRAVSWTLASVFALGVSVFAFVLFVVHNCIFLLLLLAFSSLLIALLYWNACNWRRHSLAFFLSRLPNSDLAGAADGQYVKVTGVATCGSVVYESSYEKAARCVYTSTSLYQYEGMSSLLVNNGYRGWSSWKLIYSERLVTDFFVTDRISGLRVMVRAGFGSKVIPLVDE